MGDTPPHQGSLTLEGDLVKGIQHFKASSHLKLNSEIKNMFRGLISHHPAQLKYPKHVLWLVAPFCTFPK